MIRRYYATKDNTISNMFLSNLSDRGINGNTSQSDILEVFSLYAQRDSGSAELSRILVQFPVSTISSDRAAGTIPASGSVSFFLNLYNAEHTRTLPRDFKLTINAVSVGAWEEGLGLDMENYSDKTYDKIGSNWVNANGTFTSASVTLKLAGDTNLASMHGQTFDLTDSDGTTQTFTIDYNSSTLTGGTIGFNAPGADQNDDAIAAIKSAINNISALDITASTITAVGDATSEHTLVVKQKTTGFAGNTSIDVSGVTGLSIQGSTSGFTGGSGKWSTAGGDFHTDTSSSFEQSFEIGTEDLSIDVTTLVEQWINSGGNVLGSKDNYGFLIKLSGAYEAYDSTNTGGALKSYYTKKFFARSSEFFFDRPSIEARWDSSRRDNRGNFYLSSSLLTPSDNLNTLFLYNYFRGTLRDIAGSDSVLPVMKLYYSSGSVPEGSARRFRNSSVAEVSHLTASRVSTGVYKATFAASSSIVTDTYPYLVDVWSYAEQEIHTGSAISPKTHSFSNYNPDSKYVISMPNLKKSYPNDQTQRFRLYARYKNWNPNIYSKTKSSPETLLIESASYQIKRLSDNRVVIPYGTASTKHTILSYDVSGNYFDLDMSMLESGYTYGISYSFYEDSIGDFIEQPYMFNIRVEKNEY